MKPAPIDPTPANAARLALLAVEHNREIARLREEVVWLTLQLEVEREKANR